MKGTVAVITNIPRPYRQALFSAARMKLGREGLGLRVLYTSDPSKHLRRGSHALKLAGRETEAFVDGLSLRMAYDRVVSLPTKLAHNLVETAPVCLVLGGFGIDALIAARWASRNRVPYVIWSGAWPGHERAISPVSLGVRRRLVRKADAFIAYGTAAGEYLLTLGASRERVFYAWNTVDLEAIAATAHDAAGRRSELTAKYDLAAKNLLFVGTLVESKGLRELMSAAISTKATESDWAFHLVGSGPLKDELESVAREAGKETHFRFHGLRPGSDVAELLGVVDGLILPTKREAWGLVINEAMACGVPVVASPHAGATRDLIKHGTTGYVIDPAETSALAAMISRLLANDPECAGVGLAGAEAVRAKASIDKSADGFVAAVRDALGTKAHG